MLTVEIIAAKAEAVVGVAVALSPIDLFFHFVGKVGRRGRVFLVESCARALPITLPPAFQFNFAASGGKFRVPLYQPANITDGPARDNNTGCTKRSMHDLDTPIQFMTCDLAHE